MDFLDYDIKDLYFDKPLSKESEALLKKAADSYPARESENILLDMHAHAPENLTIIVALYRFYYYQHRYQDAMDIATKSLSVSAAMLNIRVEWEELTEQDLGMGVFISLGLIRFYMLSLKASAYLLMRMDKVEEGYARLKKIVELDPADQFGAAFLLKVAEKELSVKEAERHNVESIFQR